MFIKQSCWGSKTRIFDELSPSLFISLINTLLTSVTFYILNLSINFILHFIFTFISQKITLFAFCRWSFLCIVYIKSSLITYVFHVIKTHQNNKWNNWSLFNFPFQFSRMGQRAQSTVFCIFHLHQVIASTEELHSLSFY